MIDVWGVVANGLWIVGLALLLAALSWAYWAAGTEGTGVRAVLRRPWAQRLSVLGLLLFCAGLAATGRRWWERAVWGLLAATLVVQALLTGWGRRAN